MMSRTGGLVPYKRQWNFRKKGWCELCRQPLSHNGRDYIWHVGGKRDHLQLELVYASAEMFPYRRWKHLEVLKHFAQNDEPKRQAARLAYDQKTAQLTESLSQKSTAPPPATPLPPLRSPTIGLRALYRKFDEQGLDRRRELFSLLSFLIDRGVVVREERDSWAMQMEPGKTAFVHVRQYIFNTIINAYPIADTAGVAGMCQALIAPRYMELVYDLCGFHTLFRNAADDKLDQDRVYSWRNVGNYGGYNEYKFKEDLTVTRKTAFMRGVMAQLKWALMEGDPDEGPFPPHPLHWKLTPDIRIAAKQFMMQIIHEMVYQHSAESMARVEPLFHKHRASCLVPSEKGQTEQGVYMSVQQYEAPPWQQQGVQLLTNPTEYGVTSPEGYENPDDLQLQSHGGAEGPPPGFRGDLLGMYPRNVTFAGALKPGSRSVKEVKERDPNATC